MSEFHNQVWSPILKYFDPNDNNSWKWSSELNKKWHGLFNIDFLHIQIFISNYQPIVYFSIICPTFYTTNTCMSKTGIYSNWMHEIQETTIFDNISDISSSWNEALGILHTWVSKWSIIILPTLTNVVCAKALHNIFIISHSKYGKTKC